MCRGAICVICACDLSVSQFECIVTRCDTKNSTKSLMLHDQKGDLLTCTLLTYRHCWVAAATTGKPLSVLGRRHRKLSIGRIGNEEMSPPHLQRLELPQKMLILLVLLKSPKWLLLPLHCTRRILVEPCVSILGWRPPMLPGTRVRLTKVFCDHDL